MSKVWWIKREGDGNLGLMAKPEPGDLREQLRELKAEGAEEIICLMTEGEIEEYKLHELGDACDREGLLFKRFSLPPDGVPVVNSGLDDFLQATARDLKAGRSIVLQCSTGRGRCAMVAAALMSLEGTEPEISMKALRSARHASAPETSEQQEWIRMYAQQAKPFRHEAKKPLPFYRRVSPLVWVGAATAVVGAVAAVVLRQRQTPPQSLWTKLIRR